MFCKDKDSNKIHIFHCFHLMEEGRINAKPSCKSGKLIPIYYYTCCRCGEKKGELSGIDRG